MAIRKYITGNSISMAIAFMMIMSVFITLLAALLPGDASATDSSISCARQLNPSTNTPGQTIVTGVFSAINALLSKIGQTMYQGIIGASGFRAVVGVAMTLYVAIYGVMIMLNLASYKMGEVTARLVRLAIFAILLLGPIASVPGFNSAWDYFYSYFVNFFLGGMNELITVFGCAATGNPIQCAGTLWSPISAAPSSPGVDTTAVSVLFGPMNIVFSPFFLIAIFSLLFAGFTGFVTSAGLIYGFVQFGFMMLGALVTYIRAVVGLTFLFGIAPLFLAFFLFQRTRQIFFGWLNMCVGFALTPVMLFAFLAFYSLLINTVLTSMFRGVDFCWARFFSLPGTPVDIGMWRPTIWDGNHWTVNAGDYVNPDETPKPPPISNINTLFFVFVCHLGNNFSKYIDEIAATLSDGLSGGVTTASGITSWLKGQIPQSVGKSKAPGRQVSANGPSASQTVADVKDKTGSLANKKKT